MRNKMRPSRCTRSAAKQVSAKSFRIAHGNPAKDPRRSHNRKPDVCRTGPRWARAPNGREKNATLRSGRCGGKKAALPERLNFNEGSRTRLGKSARLVAKLTKAPPAGPRLKPGSRLLPEWAGIRLRGASALSRPNGRGFACPLAFAGDGALSEFGA